MPNITQFIFIGTDKVIPKDLLAENLVHIGMAKKLRKLNNWGTKENISDLDGIINAERNHHIHYVVTSQK